MKPGIRPVGGEDPDKKKKASGTAGSKAILKRNKKGDLESTLLDDFGGVSASTIKEDRITRAGTGNGTYDGVPAPRVGGLPIKPLSGPVNGGSKSQIRLARRRVRGNAASKAAKRSAIRLY